MEEELNKTLDIILKQKNLLIEELNRPTTDIDRKTKLIFDIDKLDQLIKNNS